jgi:hypothetical protein
MPWVVAAYGRQKMKPVKIAVRASQLLAEAKKEDKK